MLQIKGLTKTFPRPKQKRARRARTPRPHNGKHFYAVRNVTFQAEKAKILGLLGPNGAGKTTLLRMLSTALKPTAGTAVFDGVDLIKSPLDVRAKIGFLSDNTGLYGRLTAREMIEYFGSLHAMDRRTLKNRVDELFDVLVVGHGAEADADVVLEANGTLDEKAVHGQPLSRRDAAAVGRLELADT